MFGHETSCRSTRVFSSKTQSRKRQWRRLEHFWNGYLGDETWVYEFDMQTSKQSSEWRFPTEPKPKKSHQNQSKAKMMLSLNYRDVAHSEFLSQSQMVNKEYYLNVKRPDSGKKTHEFCTMITHHLIRLSWTNFWPKAKKIPSNNRILLIWLRPTFSV